MKSMVAGFMFDERGYVLLIEKTKPAWQAGRLNGVGGKIEPGETPIQAMVREFKEETDVDTTPEEWGLKVHLKGPDYEVYFFAASRPKLTGVKKTTDELPKLVTAAYLPVACLPNLRWLIPICRDLDLNFPIEIQDKIKEPGSGTGPIGMTARTAKAAAC